LDPEAAAAAAAAADLALRSEIGAVDEAQGRWLIGQNGDVQEDSANAAVRSSAHRCGERLGACAERFVGVHSLRLIPTGSIS